MDLVLLCMHISLSLDGDVWVSELYVHPFFQCEMHYPGMCAWKLDWDDYFINFPAEIRVHSCLFNYLTNLMFISEDRLPKFAFMINCKDPLNQIVGISKPFKTFGCTASTQDFLGFKATAAEIEFKKWIEQYISTQRDL